MNITEKLKQSRIDYEYIVKTYGPVIDFTGSGMEDSQLNLMLDKPTKDSAFKCYKERIEHLFENGYGGGQDILKSYDAPLPVSEDLRLQEIGSNMIYDGIYLFEEDEDDY